MGWNIPSGPVGSPLCVLDLHDRVQQNILGCAKHFELFFFGGFLTLCNLIRMEGP